MNQYDLYSYYKMYPNADTVNNDTDCNEIFKLFCDELMNSIKNKKVTKMPSALALVAKQNKKWNHLNELYLSNGKCIGIDGFILRLKAMLPEIFSEETNA